MLLFPLFSFDFTCWLAIKYIPSMVMRTAFGTPGNILKEASPHEKKRLTSFLYHLLPISSRVGGMKNEHEHMSESVMDYISEISLPTLILSYADDLYGTFEIGKILAGQISNAKFIGYLSGGHK